METSELSEYDLFLFHQGTNYRAYEMLGAHIMEQNGKKGVRFTVWAPHAKEVSVVGDFNNWDTRVNKMSKLGDGEIWNLFIPDVGPGTVYKYAILPQHEGPHIMKADPYGFFAEKKPETASIVYELGNYKWKDSKWAKFKEDHPSYTRPMLTYEVHLGSWRRTPDGEYLSYMDMADQLVDYVKSMNYTHIELMPLCEHPFDGSWGYQATGYYAVTSRYGTPDEFRYLVDKAHQAGIGIIMDWVPGHFCKDNQGLRDFDGQNLYESDNIQRADNAGWGTVNFDYGRTEVQSFLISNAMFWMDQYHIDGLRIDAVANMLYLNYGRQDGDWVPNKFGGDGNLEAIDFLHKLNEAVFKNYPQALMIAEESTSWPNISKPVYMGGMGFNYKWNMGWMNDILRYISLDPIYRKWHHDKLTFSLMYAFSENFVLPLSHDEVVHGKCSLISKMPGDYWQKFAGLRAFFGYWMAHPGKKLLFMGGEFGQFIEWNFDDSLDWHLVEQYEKHTQMLEYSRALNKFYVDHKAFWEVDFDWRGFEWIDCDNADDSLVSFIRKAEDGSFIIAISNFTPEVRHGYRFGVPAAGVYREIFNSDAEEFGGSNVLNDYDIVSEDMEWQGKANSILVTVPPLATIYLELQSPSDDGVKKKTTAKKTTAKKTTVKAKATSAAKTRTTAKAKKDEPEKAESTAKKTTVKKASTTKKTTTTKKTATAKKTTATKTAAAKAEAEEETKPKTTRTRKTAVKAKEDGAKEVKPKTTRGRKPKAETAQEAETKPKPRTRKATTAKAKEDGSKTAAKKEEVSEKPKKTTRGRKKTEE
ncbi:1,4-alpha-glucan branching enzyme [Anaerovibrio lipolyticus DSM 3074]|uniref:1,4-alpha-glucan branching enzyme GlgB n=2 Tax=Anaerovibrio lipolyticus TaxID=82374 RepID=A0A0B2K0P7_9FIRM|nr:1,4-alpha-glucan branching protein GlgB [Anaerovibrio lipolyticus]KHM52396.1 1,4-alpha-glucan branching protein [Anaerovibrio lipolyticus]SHI92021.1 1,4-alpha-glucan branching enzyme [Anaerovibrio lipolyticus DSM 3074]